MLYTKNCVRCGHIAISWRGHVVLRECLTVLDGYKDIKVMAGLCKYHEDINNLNKSGYFDEYKDEMGLLRK